MKISDLKFGDTVRAECTAVGRYLGNKKVLFVCAMDNDLSVDDLAIPIKTDNAHNLPLPSDKDLQKYIKDIPKCFNCESKIKEAYEKGKMYGMKLSTRNFLKANGALPNSSKK